MLEEGYDFVDFLLAGSELEGIGDDDRFSVGLGGCQEVYQPSVEGCLEALIFRAGHAKEGYGLDLGTICCEKCDVSIAGFALGEDFIHFVTGQPVILMLEVRVKRRLVDGVRDHKNVCGCGFVASDGEFALVDRHLELWVAYFTILFRGKGFFGWFGW